MNNEKPIKLIPGQMNVIRTVLKAGYAEGVIKPKKIVKPKLFNPIVILRKAV